MTKGKHVSKSKYRIGSKAYKTKGYGGALLKPRIRNLEKLVNSLVKGR